MGIEDIEKLGDESLPPAKLKRVPMYVRRPGKVKARGRRRYTLEEVSKNLKVSLSAIQRIMQESGVQCYVDTRKERGSGRIVEEVRILDVHYEWMKKLFKDRIHAEQIKVFEPIYYALQEIADVRQTSMKEMLKEEIEVMVARGLKGFVPSVGVKGTSPEIPSEEEDSSPEKIALSGNKKVPITKEYSVPIAIDQNTRQRIMELEGETVNLPDIAEFAIVRILQSHLNELWKTEEGQELAAKKERERDAEDRRRRERWREKLRKEARKRREAENA